MGRPTPYIGAPSEVNSIFLRQTLTGLAALPTADSLRNHKVYILVITIVADVKI